MINLPADKLDRASDLAETERQAAIQAALSQAGLPRTGFCLWCVSPIPTSRSFCDADCGDDYHQHQKFRGR